MNPQINEEFHDLLAKAADGSLDHEHTQRLSALLAETESNRQLFHDYLDLHTDLQWLLAPESLQLPSGLESLTTERTETVTPFPVRRRLTQVAGGLGIAASLALAFVFLRPNSPELVETDPPAQFVARITLDEGAVWNEHSSIHRDGSWLGKGSLQLESGKLGITFNTGAKLILAGPAALDINGIDRAFLHSGEISAQVPPQAIGFLISTPNGNILDLGTEFHVNVSSGESKVEVTDGMVEAYATGTSGQEIVQIVNEDEAISMAGNTESPIKKLGPVTASEAVDWSRLEIPEFLYVHYGFNESKDPYASAGNRPRKLPGTATNHWGEEGIPKTIRGRFGNGLSFAGDGGCVTTPFPGIRGGRPRTVAFWVKLDPNVRGPSGQAIVSWGAAEKGQRWQIGWNNNHAWGEIGALRTDFFSGYVTGTTDLRDGRWHHVVSVFIGGRKPDVASHVLHYVDGRLEGVSGRKSKRIDTGASQADNTNLLIGAQVNDGRQRVAFEGALDELYIVDAALLPEQIVELHNTHPITGGAPPKK